MSDGHGSHDHGHGDVATPSAGISPWMKFFLAISILTALWQGSNVIRSSDDAHVWPSSNAATVKLPPYAP
jgi:hypothetical protein